MVINPIVGVYIPIIRLPIKGGMTIPNIATFDHGTYNPTNRGQRFFRGDILSGKFLKPEALNPPEEIQDMNWNNSAPFERNILVSGWCLVMSK